MFNPDLLCGNHDSEAPTVRLAMAEDVGVVHRVVLTTGHDEGYVIVGTGAYNLHTWAGFPPPEGRHGV